MTTSRLPAEIVADAIVVLSALIGGRARLVFIDPAAPRVAGATDVAQEVVEHLPALAHKRRLNAADLVIAFRLLPIVWHDISVYSGHQAQAEALISHRDPDDWPVVALALALNIPVWSQDRDFATTGLTVFTTGDWLDLLR